MQGAPPSMPGMMPVALPMHMSLSPLADMGQPNSTLYVQNLNERVALKYLIPQLRKLFSPYGDVADVVAKRRLALRGQAFILFRDVDSARKALEGLQGERLYGKSMVIKYARYKSDLVSKVDGTYEIEKRRREQDRIEKAKQPRITRRQMLAQVMSNPAMQGMMAMPMPAAMGRGMGMGTGPMHSPQTVGAELQIPNKVLYLQNLPVEKNVEGELNDLFHRYPGYVEVRMVANRPDLAFVEYENEMQAATARAVLDNYPLTASNKIRVSFARR